MEFGRSGVLNEGMFGLGSGALTLVTAGGLHSWVDGIHVDMDRLKKGEVK
jgi:hypothetical protein